MVTLSEQNRRAFSSCLSQLESFSWQTNSFSRDALEKMLGCSVGKETGVIMIDVAVEAVVVVGGGVVVVFV